MTLQYRIRSKYADQLWRERVYLCEQLLSETYDRWCRSDHDFPVRGVVAAALYLFSPRFNPTEMSTNGLSERLLNIVGTPEEEYRLTWPKRDGSLSMELIAAMSMCVMKAVQLSTESTNGGPLSAELAEWLISEIIARQYVVFHHCETTRRDDNHWGI